MFKDIAMVIKVHYFYTNVVLKVTPRCHIFKTVKEPYCVPLF